MAALDSDNEEDLVSYGKGLEPLEEGERPKKPVPLQDQTVRDEKGRYKRFHGAFSGGFSAGYFNTVGSKEGWTPSTFVSSRQNRADRSVLGPEDFMDEEDLSEFGIAPKAIVTTDDFASQARDRIQEKARQLAAATAPIPGATLLDDLVTPATLSIGFELLRKMGWKEGQGVGPRVKRRPRRQKPDSSVKVYGCALPPGDSDGSQDEDDDYLPENVTFAPKDVTPVDFTPKDNVHGLAYRGLDPRQALFGASGEHFNLFGGGPEEPGNLLGDIRVNKGRKLGISGQAFGVGALEEEDDDIYATETLSKYDTVLRDEEPGDGLYGWTAPKQYRAQKDSEKDLRYVGKILDGFSLAAKPLSSKKTYPPPELPKDYRPVHYFRPAVAATAESPHLRQMLAESTGKAAHGPGTQSRHQLNAARRGELLGETPAHGSATSVLEFLTQKDKERIQEMKQATDLKAAQLKAQQLAQDAAHGRLWSPSADSTLRPWHSAWGGGGASAATASSFKPFARDPEKQKRYEEFLANVKRGQKDALERSLDPSMTEWERGRERDEFARAALLYVSSSSTLSSRFTHAKEDDDTDQVEVPRDQENDVGDKQSAVKMKMFGRLTRDAFEWHPDKLLCKRFNVPDPYPDSTLVGLPRVKRDKYSVFNFLTLPEPSSLPTTPASHEKGPQHQGDKSRRPSRWDTSKQEKKEDSISEFLSLARSKVDSPKPAPSPSANRGKDPVVESSSDKAVDTGADSQAEGEGSRPSMDLFKAIFASSSDEKSSSSEDEPGESEEEEEEEEEKEGTGEAGLQSSQEPGLETPSQASKPTPPEPAPAFPVQKMQLDEREEFGPRLPPVFCPNARREPEPPPLPPLPKEKHKRSKEKHKAKKEPRRKRGKKKKHRKHKHKGKQKNKKSEKSSSSGSTASSGSESDEDEVAGLSPQELLRRLKRFPLKRQ